MNTVFTLTKKKSRKEESSQIIDKAKKIYQDSVVMLSSDHTSIFLLLTMECTCFISRFISRNVWGLYVHVSTFVYKGRTWWECTCVWTSIMAWTAESCAFSVQFVPSKAFFIFAFWFLIHQLFYSISLMGALSELPMQD